MTWRKLFFKSTFYDVRRRSWCMALIFIIQFFYIPVHALMCVQQYRSLGLNDYYGYFGVYAQESISSVFEENVFVFSNLILLAVLIVSAVILAMTGFSYLNSKKKVDFTHSMPVKREVLFLSRYAAGVLLYAIPLFLNVGIGLLLAVFFKGITIYVLKSAFWFFVYHLVYFLLFYSTAILAIVLIGNLVVSFLGMGILFSYQSVMWLLVENFKATFFETYMSEYKMFQAYDPIGLLIHQLGSFNHSYYTYDYAGRAERIEGAYFYSTGGKTAIIALIGAIIAGAAALLLFRVRKSEAAGKSLVFPKSEPIAKVALLLPFGALGGMGFYQMASGFRVLWYIFGAATFFALTAIVIEIIFRQDFKSFFKHKISALTGAGVILVFTLCFWLDLLGYDTRIPKSSQIESIGISIPIVEMGNADHYYSDYDSFYDYTNSASDHYYYDVLSGGYMYRSGFNDILNLCTITGEEEIEKVRALAGYYAKNRKSFEKLTGFSNLSNISHQTAMWATDEEGKEEKEDVQWVNCQVVYRLKNGKKVYRSYFMPYGEGFLDAVEPVFANEDYKMTVNPVLMDTVNYSYLFTQNNFMENRTRIARDNKKELLECLKKDVMKLTFEEAWTENKKGSFYMTDTLGGKYSGACYVYEGYDNTLGWLSENGASLENNPDAIHVADVEIDYYGSTDSYKTIYLKDEQEKEDILEYLVRSEFVAPGAQTSVEFNITVMVEYSIKTKIRGAINDNEPAYSDEEEYFGYYPFNLKEIPDFVKDKLKL